MEQNYPPRPPGRKTATLESRNVGPPGGPCSTCIAAIADRLLGGIERATHRLSNIEEELALLNDILGDAAAAGIPGYLDERQRRLEACELARRESNRWAS